MAMSSSLLKKAPGEGTGPTRESDASVVGRVPPRGAPGVVQQAAQHPRPAPVVLITGAAGGLGRALADEFARAGWRVAAGYHRSGFDVETQTLWPVALDVTQRGRAKEVVGQILERWGRLDALVNNAGIAIDTPFWLMREQDWEAVVSVNLKGAWRCAQAASRPMLKQEAGHIINIASFAARSGPRGQANYAAAKAGLIGLTQSLAREVGVRNVRVNAILPGVLPTPMTAKLSAAILQELTQANVLKRLNSVTEVARFVVFLAGTQNVSGQVFQLDSRIARWT
jgi:3-oxoacyl-[acyl-carrier protein] reductase